MRRVVGPPQKAKIITSVSTADMHMRGHAWPSHPVAATLQQGAMNANGDAASATSSDMEDAFSYAADVLDASVRVQVGHCLIAQVGHKAHHNT